METLRPMVDGLFYFTMALVTIIGLSCLLKARWAYIAQRKRKQ